MNATTQLPAARQKNKTIIDLLRDDKVIKGLSGVATKYLDAERMTRIAVNAVRRTPKLMECDPHSLLGAVMFSQALGLEPNTPQGHAYLIPYDKRGKMDNGQWGVVSTECQFIIGYRGYIVMAKRNPALVKLSAAAIYEADFFDFMEGSDAFLKFRPALKDRGEMIGSFCFTKERGEYGDIDSATVLPLDEIHKIRAKSETFRALSAAVDRADSDFKVKKALEKLNETPWVMWEGDMAAKSAIRKHIKQLDLSHGLAAVDGVESAIEAGTLDMAALADPDRTKAIAAGEEAPPIIDGDEDFDQSQDGDRGEEALEDVQQQRSSAADPAKSDKSKPKAETKPEAQPRSDGEALFGDD